MTALMINWVVSLELFLWYRVRTTDRRYLLLSVVFFWLQRDFFLETMFDRVRQGTAVLGTGN